MEPYQVRGPDRNAGCFLLAESEWAAMAVIAEMKIYGVQPLTAEQDSDGPELSWGFVVLHTGETIPIPERN
jgi:hypothetical protein